MNTEQREFFRLKTMDAANERADANQRAVEAQALMDAAEKPDCSPEDRAALLSDTFALLNHAATQTAALALAYQRLRRLLGGGEG